MPSAFASGTRSILVMSSAGTVVRRNSLEEMTARYAQEISLRRGFNAFCGYLQADRARDSHNRMDDGGGFHILALPDE